jgi:branched-subunit amino acid aminotransferase/4-amino-4-deoxychorismate lyase
VTVQQIAEAPGHDPVALEPRALAGGLGRHKWQDRPGERYWLVTDLDGAVLETATANVWILRGGELLTPPDDGRLLPGTTRARLLHSAHPAREAELTLADLEAAEAIVLTSSIRLVTPAGLGTTATPRAVELARELRNDPAISRKTGSYIR